MPVPVARRTMALEVRRMLVPVVLVILAQGDLDMMAREAHHIGAREEECTTVQAARPTMARVDLLTLGLEDHVTTAPVALVIQALEVPDGFVRGSANEKIDSHPLPDPCHATRRCRNGCEC